MTVAYFWSRGLLVDATGSHRAGNGRLDWGETAVSLLWRARNAKSETKDKENRRNSRYNYKTIERLSDTGSYIGCIGGFQLQVSSIYQVSITLPSGLRRCRTMVAAMRRRGGRCYIAKNPNPLCYLRKRSIGGTDEAEAQRQWGRWRGQLPRLPATVDSGVEGRGVDQSHNCNIESQFQPPPKVTQSDPK